MSSLKINLARKVHFSSGLQYANSSLSESENKKIYGSLYSPHGFGHNFTLEAYVTGPIDETSGLIMNITDLDRLMKEVVSPLDHHFLNTDVPEFKTLVPTTENIARYCYEKLKPCVESQQIHLTKVRLYESEFQWVDCGAAL